MRSAAILSIAPIWMAANVALFANSWKLTTPQKNASHSVLVLEPYARLALQIQKSVKPGKAHDHGKIHKQKRGSEGASHPGDRV